MPRPIQVSPRFRPVLDPGFVPAALWNQAFRSLLKDAGGGEPLAIALERSGGSISVFHTSIFPHAHENAALNERYVERLVKFLLWQKGGYRLTLAGDPNVTFIRGVYGPGGPRAFDWKFMGDQVHRRPLEVLHVPYADAPQEQEIASPLGGHLQGCRIGFDLGASDRKCAAVIDGEVVFSEETPWDPSTQPDPQYHFDGIQDSLRRAAEHLPRVDAIGGSSAGVYVANEVRVASLFRAAPAELFESRVRRIFFELREAWGGIPFEVANDGEVTALAGSMALNDSAVLGIAMGSSLAAGYVTPQGNITSWLNELAFAPVDYREDAPRDEWSGDQGVGAQYFSQQAVGRLLAAAEIALPDELSLPQRLLEVQELAGAGDPRALAIYETIGVCFGYSIAHYADFYEIRNLLALGRVMSGIGGDLILQKAGEVLRAEFPDLAGQIRFHIPGERDKRHGQAVAAAGLASADSTGAA